MFARSRVRPDRYIIENETCLTSRWVSSLGGRPGRFIIERMVVVSLKRKRERRPKGYHLERFTTFARASSLLHSACTVLVLYSSSSKNPTEIKAEGHGIKDHALDNVLGFF